MAHGKVVTGIVAAVSIAAAAWASSNKRSAFGYESAPMPASVRILAVSSSSRQSFAGNRDVYLADVQVKKGEHHFARLIDQYPGFALPIRHDLLQDRTPLTMKVMREPECDEPGAKVFLPPGNAVVYDGGVRETLANHAADAIPCYKTLHQTIQIAKR